MAENLSTPRAGETTSDLVTVGIGAALAVGFIGFKVLKGIMAVTSAKTAAPAPQGNAGAMNPATGLEVVKMFANHSANMAKISGKGW